MFRGIAMAKYEYKIDVPVLLIFFNRPGCFSKVFEQVKTARPSKLFLYQDGAREGNEKDAIGVEKCREIASDIDWDCEVHTKYQEKNYGCDPSEYIAQTWALSYVDRCIVIEDDVVPDQSFFPYCAELLERYKDDDRVNMICGMNSLEKWETPYSYLFTETGSISGWATWKRVVDEWEPKYDILDDEFNRKKLDIYMNSPGFNLSSRWKTWEKYRAEGVEHYEAILGINQYVQNRLNIVPAVNLVSNIGNTTEGGTHSVDDVALIPKGLRKIFTLKKYAMSFPMKHPKYMINDIDYQKALYRVMGSGHPCVQFYRKIEKSLLLIRYKGFKALIKKIKTK